MLKKLNLGLRIDVIEKLLSWAKDSAAEEGASVS
jgi:hypothetical protein